MSQPFVAPARGALTLTPNRRLARSLQLEFAANERARGLVVWETPLILPWDAWLSRLWDHAVAAGAAPAASLRLLSPLAEAALWEQVLDASAVLDPLLPAARLVPEAMAAWRALHAGEGPWRRAFRGPLTPAAERFAAWAEQYEERCRREAWLDSARLPDQLIETLAGIEGELPRHLTLHWFQRLTAQQKRLLLALEELACEIETVAAGQARTQPELAIFADRGEELRAASSWAAAQANRRTCARIGIVVPDLSQRREAVSRAFADALAPRSVVAPWGPPQRQFEFSLGTALAGAPIVAAALAALQWGNREFPLPRWSALLRSPHLAGDAAEIAARSRLERVLAEEGWQQCSVAQTLQQCRLRSCAPRLAAALADWLALLDACAPRQSASDWRRQWEAELAALGWPGASTLSSAEYQAREAWSRLLDQWIKLDALLGRVGRDEALQSLARAAETTLFQPEGQGARVEILGALEAAGQRYEALWVMGLTADLWPRETSPSAFLPLAWQKAQRLPEASPEAALAEARELLGGYLAQADAVIFSRAQASGDEPLLPSPLLAQWPNAERMIAHASPPTVPEAIAAAARIIEVSEDAGIALSSAAQARASSYTLAAQAECPFQAYGRHRLEAHSWPIPGAGLGAQERGKLVHRALQQFWGSVGDQARLRAFDAPALAAQIGAAVEHALNSVAPGRWRGVPEFVRTAEEHCLRHLLLRWLEQEKERPEFRVLAGEQDLAFGAGGLSMQLRPDRIDELAGGWRVIIDYKTGRSGGPTRWLERPIRDPQLPLYALAEPSGRVAAVAVARVRADKCEAEGLAAERALWPDLRAVPRAADGASGGDWDTLRGVWAAEITKLAESYRLGEASLRPREGDATCRVCDLAPLCRVREREFSGEADADGEETGDDAAA